MRIGSIELGDRPILLAPMEDVSDPPFRVLCKRFGADLLYTEFVSTGGLVHGAEGSLSKLDLCDEERPVAVQIFGGDVDQVREAIPIVEAARPDVIDINFGCPVRKVVCKDGGAGILRNLPKMRDITRAVVGQTRLPVTVKTRLGWSEDTIRILDVARMLQEEGIRALAVHARTRSQMYRGEADWSWLRRLKDDGGLSLPLIGNGDATTPEKIDAMFRRTGVDAVMVGRGAIGNPWIFRDAKHYLATGESLPAPSWEERIAVVAEHLTLKCEWLGERTGVREMRRMYGGYFRGFPAASRLRAVLMAAETREAVLDTLVGFGPGEEAGQARLPGRVNEAA